MQIKMYFELIILIFNLLKHTQSIQNDDHVCSAIKIPMCIEMPYNTTRMPNLLRHRTQEEAAIMAHEFIPLVDIGCSPHVRFFICSVFAPMCTSKISFGVPSCRLVCLSVRESCLPVLMRLNFTWPPFLRCDLFPQDGLCMMPPNLKPHLGNPSLKFKESSLPNRPKPTIHQDVLRPIKGDRNFIKGISNSDANANWTLKLSDFPFGTSSICSKGRSWISIDDEQRVCTPVCGEDFLFTAAEKWMAKLWVASWAFVCLASTAFTILTFCLDRKRFKYPERPVICLALSYFFYCLPFVMTLLFTNEELSCETDPVTGIKHLAVAGTSSSGCVASFLMQYYFGLASDMWWTILTFCWFMSSGRFWGSEGLSHFDTYFYLLAWGTPALASVLVILFRQIDGDELTGLCFVGNLRPSSLLIFVIIPQAVLVSLGTVFVVLGLLGLFRIRNIIRLQTTNYNAASSSLLSSSVNQDRMTSPTLSTPTSNASIEVLKLERLMIRLGVYATLSTIPAALVLIFRLCFYFGYDGWVEEASSVCHEGWNQKGCLQTQSRTVLSLFRLFMSLVVGVTSGIWVWSPKTFKIWRKTLTLICSFPLNRFKKTSNINAPPQFVMGNINSSGDLTQVQQSSSSNIPENDIQNFLEPSNYEISRSASTVRTSQTSSRHHLLRNSESSFV